MEIILLMILVGWVCGQFESEEEKKRKAALKKLEDPNRYDVLIG